MPSISAFLNSLISTSGISGHEVPVRKIIEGEWQSLVDELTVSRLGSLHGLKRGNAKEPRPALAMLAHMDAIGLMVTRLTEGFLHVTHVGGVDARILPGTPVVVHATGSGKPQQLPGIVVQPPARLLPESARDEAVSLKYLLIDTGLPPKRIAKLVQVGDLVSFDTDPVELAGGTLTGHSLDNRASVAALTACLQELSGRHHAWDVWGVASVREESGGLAGAATSIFQLRPDLAVAVDVTFGRGPGASDWQTFALGSGPTLGWGANIHPALHKRFKELAEKLEMPHSVEIMPASSGTDGMAAQISREGVPTMVVSIPLRYMHTPVEMVAYQDVERAGRLLAEFAANLETDFLEKIVWDD